MRLFSPCQPERGHLLLLGAALLLASGSFFDAGPALAQPYPPELRFRTLESAHFVIHHPEDSEAAAFRVMELAERAHQLLVPEFAHEPREKTQIVIADIDDSANGSASSIPYNTIRLHMAPPGPLSTLNTFDDYLWILIVHEYAHILHLDTVRGLPWLGNRIFGKQFSPNGAWPSLLVEGLAVVQESRQSSAGRLRSSLHAMELRMHLLEGRDFDLVTLLGPPLSWPRRDGWYLYGGRFLAHLDSLSPGILRTLSQENAPRVWPYMLNTSLKRHLGKSLDTLFEQWIEGERQKALELAASLDPSPFEALSQSGEIRRSPRLSPDGLRIYSIFADADKRAQLMELDLEEGGEKRLAFLNGAGSLAVTAEGKLLISQPDIHRNFSWFDDLFLFDPETGSSRRLSRGARLSEPDVSTNGQVVAIRRSAEGRTELVLFESFQTIDKDTGHILFRGEPGSPVASPRFSPSGRKLAFSHHSKGGWNLLLLNLEDGGVTQLQSDGSQNLHPSFSPDGRFLYFSSDRSGIYNLYRLDLESGALHQQTRMLGGAFEVQAAEDELFFITYNAQGYDLAKQPRALESQLDSAPDSSLKHELNPDFDSERDFDFVSELASDIDSELTSNFDSGPDSDSDSDLASDSDSRLDSDFDSELDSDFESDMTSDFHSELASSFDSGLDSDFNSEKASDFGSGLDSDSDSELASNFGSGPDSDSDSRLESDVDPELDPDFDSGPDSDSDSELASGFESVLDSDFDAELDPDFDSELNSESAPETEPDFESDFESDSESDFGSEPDTESASDFSQSPSSRPYSPWATLRPAYWSPLLGQDPAGYTLGLSTTGFDVLRRWQWGASLWFGLASYEPGGSIYLRSDAIWPALTLQIQRAVRFSPGMPASYGEEQIGGRLSSDWVFRSRWRTFRMILGWELVNMRPASFNDAFLSSQGRRGLDSAPSLSLSYSSSRRFQRSISTAEGSDVSLSMWAAGPWSGSDFQYFQAEGSWRLYVPMPVLRHVLALQTSAGLGVGDSDRRAFFALGGPLTGGVQVMGVDYRFPFRLLRGFPHAAFSGPGFALANIEYRFPLFAPETGVSWLPVSLRQLHAAVFTDVGSLMYSSPPALGTVRAGSGMEFRAQLTLGYRLQTDLRLGFARGWGEEGISQLLLLLGASY